MADEGRRRDGFVHSVKVPRLYKNAAKALQLVEEHKEGLKTAIHSVKHPNVKAISALVSEALRHRQLIDLLLTKSKLQEKEPRLDINVGKILITELFWGKKRIGGGAKPVQTILSYQEKFEKILERYFRQVKSGKIPSYVEDQMDFQPIRKPRYVRVNTLVKSLDDVIYDLEMDNWRKVQPTNPGDLDASEFFVDPVVENLLVFCPGTELHKYPMYLDGTFILQDKASCLPALALKPRRGKVVMDACAAPGMKTSHLAAIMQDEGKIYAVEKNSRRCETLKSMIESLNVHCVSVLNKDFTDIDPEEYPDVEYILVDPSCSGSGMYNRINETKFGNQPDDNDTALALKDRLANLSFYQRKLLMHAMKFPGVKKIVYSTCSLHSEENEDVVAFALEQNESQQQFRVKSALKTWPHRVENHNYPWSTNCIKCDFDTDQTDGFFVALLEKTKVKK